MNKILTISVAAYNVEKYISDIFGFLELSTELQKKIEIIVVNDGSKDNTVSVVKQFQKKYPDTVILIDKENGGYGSTINAALKKANGKYFKLLDGDDWLNKNNINEFIYFLENSSTDLVIAPYERIYEETRKIELVDRHNKSDVALKQYLHMAEITILTEKIRRLNESITEKCFYTDVEFALLTMIASDYVVKFDKPVYCYRIGREGQSVSPQGRMNHYKDNEIVIKTIMEWYKKYADYMTESKKNIYFNQMVISSVFHFKTFCLFPKENSKKVELIEFDQYLKANQKEIFHAMNKSSRLIKMVRSSRYGLFGIASLWLQKKY